jgi:hypothetical protein
VAMPNHRPARAPGKRVPATLAAAVHINPCERPGPEKIAAPQFRGATIVEPKRNSADRAALALPVSVVLAALARLLRLLSRLLLSATLLLLAGLLLATATLLLAALAWAWSVLLLLVRIPLVRIIH